MKPTLLFYCQHSLGMGHLVRSLALAEAFARDFEVTLLSGGRFPRGLRVGPSITVVNLAPLALDAAHQLVSGDRRRSVERAGQLRRETILATYARLRPAVVLVELFPFGRKKFAGEILPLLEAAKGNAKIVCSLRDILVGGRRDQLRFEEKAVATSNKWFDALLVHSDETFARLEDSLKTDAKLTVPIHYTGFVVPDATRRKPVKAPRTAKKIIVSAGGGIVGEELLRAAAEAHRILSATTAVETELVTGVFLPPAKIALLRAETKQLKGVKVTRFIPNLRDAMAAADVSVSQCGYNTAFDIMLSGVPALVVPYAAKGEDEQTIRARKLESRGLLRVLGETVPSGRQLAAAISETFDFRPSGQLPAIDGGARSASVLRRMLPAKTVKSFENDWLAPVRRALDAATADVRIFFRNDDAGIEDARLFKLLDLFEAIGLPLDLAVIPKAVTKRFAARLSARIADAGVRFGLHQHGFAHVNHEREGRKCEFGASRSLADQLRDIGTGQEILAESFGELMEPVFTPPWNRCTSVTADALATLGFAVLSREDCAEGLDLHGLREIPVAIDWFAKRRGVRLERAAVGELIGDLVTAGKTFGIMFHHGETDASERRQIEQLGRLLAASDRIKFAPLIAAV